MNKRKPFCYVTSKGRTVRPNTLAQYAIKNTSNGVQQLPEDSFADVYGEYELINPLYTPDTLIELPTLNPYVNRCIRTISLDVAGGGYTLQPVGDGGSDSDKEFLQGFFDGLDYNLWTQVKDDLDTIGHAAIEVIRAGDQPQGEIIALDPIPAHTIRVHKSGDKYCQTRGVQSVWFKRYGYEGEVNSINGAFYGSDENPNDEVATYKRANEVIWLRKHTSKSDYYGIPDVISCLGAVYGELSRTDYNIQFFQNYGIPSYAVTITGDFDPGEEDETTGLTDLEAAIEGHFQDIISNPHSTMVLSVPSADSEGKVEVNFEPLSVETKEASFRLYRQDNRDEILTAFGMDPYRIGVTTTGSLGGNTAIESKKNYKSTTVTPGQEYLENVINTLIIGNEVGFNILGWRFKFNELDTEDETHDLTMVKDLFTMGAVTPNQIIRRFGERFGLEEVEHPLMDSHYLNGQSLETSPTNTEQPMVQEEVVKSLSRLRENLMDIALKDDEDTDNKPARKSADGLLKRLQH